MTDVSFYFNVADRSDYICRLTRKATRQGARVVLSGPAPMLTHYDRCLWTFEDVEFLAHQVLAPHQTSADAAAVQVWLTQDPAQCAHREVLVNLGDQPPAGYRDYARLIEVVSRDEADRTAARQRWKYYASQGDTIERFEVGG